MAEEAGVETAFHQMTLSFMPMWQSMLDGEWPRRNVNEPREKDKFWWITKVQQDLAMHGVQELNRRMKMAMGAGQENFFSKANSSARGFLEGKGAELDVAILLLEMVKQAMIENPELELTVIPAPPQFEKSDYREMATDEEKPKNPNVDFLVINLRTHQVAGVQVKSTRGGKEAQYDTQSGRVTILYGEDIAPPVMIGVPNYNQFTRSGKPVIHQKPHSWYGRLCVDIMQSLPTYGMDAARVFPFRIEHQGFSRRDGSSRPRLPGEQIELAVHKAQMKLLVRAVLSHANSIIGAEWPSEKIKGQSQAQTSLRSDKVQPAIQRILAEVGAA
ncbi:hypothetical protein IPL68_04990 [Candidatus Saccharibacteria bacterium]|nr:MAG: hypothetical protein IPL68_04990 [Candidatus Saccharibacteria bacterium]